MSGTTLIMHGKKNKEQHLVLSGNAGSSWYKMRRATAILLLVALPFQFVVKIGVVGYYLLNRDYIAGALCVNRSKPGMHCKGTCYLAARMTNAEEQNRLPVAPGFRYDPQEFIAGSEKLPDLAAPEDKARKAFAPYCCDYSFVAVRFVFHPPPFDRVQSLSMQAYRLYDNTGTDPVYDTPRAVSARLTV